MIPKFSKGQTVIHIPSNKEYIIKTVNTKRYIVNKNGKTTGFEDEFAGTYDCVWFDEKGSHFDNNVLEVLLFKPS